MKNKNKKKKNNIAKIILIVLIVLAALFLLRVVSRSNCYLYQSNHNKSHLGMRAWKLLGAHRDYNTVLKKKNVFFRHKVEHGVIVSTDIAINYKGKLYYLKSGIDSYDINIPILEKAFGKENCERSSDLGSDRQSYACFGDDGYSSAYTNIFGGAGANIEDDWNCSIDEDFAYCYREYEDE